MLSLDVKKLLNFVYSNKGLLLNLLIAIPFIEKKNRQTHKVIKELTDNNVIERIGSNKTGYWKIIN